MITNPWHRLRRTTVHTIIDTINIQLTQRKIRRLMGRLMGRQDTRPLIQVPNFMLIPRSRSTLTLYSQINAVTRRKRTSLSALAIPGLNLLQPQMKVSQWPLSTPTADIKKALGYIVKSSSAFKPGKVRPHLVGVYSAMLIGIGLQNLLV